TQSAAQVDRGPSVSALAHHLEVVLGVDDRGQPRADQRLVVADQDPDRRGHDGSPAGMRARTAKPPSGRRSARKSPPSTSTRSRRPTSPRPLPPGEPPREPEPSVSTSTVISFSSWRTRTEVRLP